MTGLCRTAQVDSNRIPACGPLSPKTFELYERLGLPMLLLFLSGDPDAPPSESGGTHIYRRFYSHIFILLESCILRACAT